MRRYVLVLGLLIAGSASAQAATLHRHDTHHHVAINSPRVASSFDAVPGWAEAPRPSIRYYVPSSDDRWDPWGHWGAYYGPMTGGL
jgi:hypothetical protein